jgi:uncharacterized protein with HEPN domain
MSFEPLEYVRHILAELDFLVERSAGITEDQFLADPTLQRAFERSIEILGEATKQLPDSFRAAYPDVEWRSMAGMRDRLIHGYFSTDHHLVWDVVTNKVPPLREKLRGLLRP